MADGKNGGDHDAPLYIAIFIIAIVLLAIYVFHKYIWIFNAMIGSIAWLHVTPFAAIAKLFPASESIPFIGTHLIGPSRMLHDFFNEGDFQNMSASARSMAMSVSGRIAALLYTPVLFWIALKDSDLHMDAFYKKTYNIESMLREQARTWKTVRMFTRLDPLAKPDIKPSDIAKAAIDHVKRSRKKSVGVLLSGFRVMATPAGYRRSLTPEEWLVANGLTASERLYSQLTSGSIPAGERDFVFGELWEHLSIPSINEVFRGQLRRPWRGSKNLPTIEKTLFAVMALFYAAKTKDGNAMLSKLGAMSATLPPGTPGMAALIEADKSLMEEIEKARASKHGKILDHVVMRGHAWVESAFPTLLRMARFERGVLASASFIWLKQEDRLLWYILNSTGNDTAFVEAAGALAHNKAEIQLNGPLRGAKVYQASRALRDDYLNCNPKVVAKRNEVKSKKRKIGTQLSMMAEDARKRLASLRNEEENNQLNAYTDLAERAARAKIENEYQDEEEE